MLSAAAVFVTLWYLAISTADERSGVRLVKVMRRGFVNFN
jgi:hypothetical protein